MATDADKEDKERRARGVGVGVAERTVTSKVEEQVPLRKDMWAKT